MTLSDYLKNPNIVPQYRRPMFLWGLTKTMRDIAARRFWESPEGEDLYWACVFRLMSQQELMKRGKQIAPKQIVSNDKE